MTGFLRSGEELHIFKDGLNSAPHTVEFGRELASCFLQMFLQQRSIYIIKCSRIVRLPVKRNRRGICGKYALLLGIGLDRTREVSDVTMILAFLTAYNILGCLIGASGTGSRINDENVLSVNLLYRNTGEIRRRNEVVV